MISPGWLNQAIARERNPGYEVPQIRPKYQLLKKALKVSRVGLNHVSKPNDWPLYQIRSVFWDYI